MALYSGLQVPRNLATKMGKEKETFEPWNTSQLGGKPGTRAQPSEKSVREEVVTKKKGGAKSHLHERKV